MTQIIPRYGERIATVSAYGAGAACVGRGNAAAVIRQPSVPLVVTEDLWVLVLRTIKRCLKLVV